MLINGGFFGKVKLATKHPEYAEKICYPKDMNIVAHEIIGLPKSRIKVTKTHVNKIYFARLCCGQTGTPEMNIYFRFIVLTDPGSNPPYYLSVQRSPLSCAPGLVKYVPAVARLFCLALSGSCLNVFCTE